MKVHIYLTVDGQKALAQNRELDQPWCFSVYPQEPALYAQPSKSYILVAEDIELALPTQQAVVPQVVEHLKKQIQAVYENANDEAFHLQAQLNNLLAIEHTPAAKQDSEDDLPF